MKTMSRKKKLIILCGIMLVLIFVATTGVFAGGEGVDDSSMFYGTGWALLPPIITIILALIFREVYSALFIGILIGALMYANFNVLGMLDQTIAIISSRLGDNGGIIIFIVSLGIIVALFQASGCAAAFGDWAYSHVKTKRTALISTTLLGLFFVIDDYFNALTTGNIMRPVTDAQKVSRARLAYNVDCTSAPICIIAPISSWAAAVASYVPPEMDVDGFALFLRCIPYNFYAILTLCMLFTLAIINFNFGPMRTYEYLAEEKGDIYGGTGDLYKASKAVDANIDGRVIDMVLPVVVLIGACIFGLVYTGGILKGASFIEAFSACDAFVGLPIGGIIALAFTVIYYFIRRVLTMAQFTEAVPNGAIAMTPAMLILTFSWGIEGICRESLGVSVFVENTFANSDFPMMILPAIMYILGAFVSFSTGTSWGTFGILIPISLAMFGNSIADPLCVITLSATLAGAVTGDHCSPISETAIMSSTAAQVDFMTHVMTQLPYALFTAGFSLVGFIVAGFVQNIIVLPIMVVAIVLVLVFMKKTIKQKPIKEPVRYVSKKARDIQAQGGVQVSE